MAGLRVALLGPMSVSAGGVPVRISGARQRAIVAALALAVPRPVSVESLGEMVWGLEPWSRGAVQTAVSRLRRELPERSLVSGVSGYTLAVDAADVDVHLFRALMAQVRKLVRPGGADPERVIPDVSDPDEVMRLLEEALGLWGGDPLQDVRSEGLVADHVPGLMEEWFVGCELRLDLRLANGEHAELVPVLRSLIARHKWRESLWRRLITALYRSGRQTDALDAYEQLRDHLREDLGLDPSDELLSLHRAVLNRDPAITLSAIDVTDHHTIGSQGKRRLSVPRQLPSDIASFTGREAHLAQLDALLDVLTRHVG